MNIKIIYFLAVLLIFSCENDKQVKEVEVVKEAQQESDYSSEIVEQETEKFVYNPKQEFAGPYKMDGIIYSFNDFNATEDIGVFNAITKNILLNGSERLLTEEDVENLYKGDLEVIRNTIYARHGYIFKSKKIKYLFEELIDWYQPLHNDVSNEITDIEYKNIQLLKRYEEFAEEFSISFAR